jgi:CBS domain-containing protein
MTEAPKTLGSTMSAADAAGIMLQYDVGVVPVAGEQEGLVGLVTDRDIVLRVVAERRPPTDVQLGEIATKQLVTVTPDTDLSEARDLMAAHRVRRLPVVKGGELVGILSLGDVALATASKRAVGEALEDVSESQSTEELNEAGPTPGTPERVLDQR